jgi:hypothetical protein
MPDYPAAHSMDTNWFAVDADGNIGYFGSGEGGAVPESHQSAEIEYSEDLFAAMARNNPDRIVRLNASGNILAKSLTMKKLQKEINSWLSFHATEQDRYSDNQTDDNKPLIYDLFLLLSNPNIALQLEIEALKDEDAYILCFTGEPTVVFVSHCYIATLQKLIEAKQVLGGNELNDSDYLLSQLGFFCYHTGSQAPVPYKRAGKPVSPLKLENLPEYIRDKIHWNSLDMLKFSENRKIEPIEQMQCDTWGEDKWWIDTQGNEHETHPHDRDT